MGQRNPPAFIAEGDEIRLPVAIHGRQAAWQPLLADPGFKA
jgi:hypothetical protein